MARWRFYQGVRTEWRWYHLDDAGNVIAESDRGFAELQGCMANAERAGFSAAAFQVYTRQSGSFGNTHPLPINEPASKDLQPSALDAASDKPAAT